MASARGSRKAARHRREQGLKLESLEPRLALATGLLSTLVSVVRSNNSQSLLAPGATAGVTEGTELAASVRLTRRPDSAITVSFKSLAPLEVGVPSTPLRFTPANWNQPQSVSFASFQDGSRDGDRLVPVSMTAAVAKTPQANSSKKIWIESLDSGVITPATPATDTYKGSIVGGSDGGVITGTYDGVLKRGTLALKVTLPELVNFRNRTITVNYSVGADNRVQVERVGGVAASQFRLDATYRDFGANRGLFGTFTVLQSQLGRSATATLTATATPGGVQNLAAAVGIATDGTAFSGGGFDGNGYAYSWQALGSSSTLAWNGVNFQLGGPDQPNCIPALGQTIAVPQGAYAMLNLAGAAVNGSQQNQKITLNFTDGSTAIWTQSFSDWGSPQNFGHEAIISTQSYRDTASGGSQQFMNRVYGYTYDYTSVKTLASITLPNNSNVRFLDLQLSNSAPVNLSLVYNAWGIATGSNQVANHQGFDGNGNYYYEGNLQLTIAWSGANFNTGPIPTTALGNISNFVRSPLLPISMPLNPFSWLYLAGAGANGNQTNQQLKLLFSDGSTAIWTQSFSDWCNPQNYNGETIIQMQPQRVNQVGSVVSQTNYVYGYAYQVPAGKKLVSVALPNNVNVGILAMAVM